MSDLREYAYRFEYADQSACEIMPDGRMFLTWPNGKREEKHGKIDNRIPLLIGQAAKPRQDEIASLRAQLAIAETNVRKWNDAFDVQSAQLASARKALEQINENWSHPLFVRKIVRAALSDDFSTCPDHVHRIVTDASGERCERCGVPIKRVTTLSSALREVKP